MDTADAQIFAERLQIDVAAHATLGHDMADMSRRPQIAHGRRAVVVLPFECRCEAVEVWSAWPLRRCPSNFDAEKYVWREAERQFTGKRDFAAANSPLPHLPIRQEF